VGVFLEKEVKIKRSAEGVNCEVPDPLPNILGGEGTASDYARGKPTSCSYPSGKDLFLSTEKKKIRGQSGKQMLFWGHGGQKKVFWEAFTFAFFQFQGKKDAEQFRKRKGMFFAAHHLGVIGGLGPAGEIKADRGERKESLLSSNYL